MENYILCPSCSTLLPVPEFWVENGHALVCTHCGTLTASADVPRLLHHFGAARRSISPLPLDDVPAALRAEEVSQGWPPPHSPVSPDDVPFTPAAEEGLFDMLPAPRRIPLEPLLAPYIASQPKPADWLTPALFSNWSRVRDGMHMVYVGVCLMLLSAGAFLLSPVAGAIGSSNVGMVLLIASAGLLALASHIATIRGLWYCLRVTDEQNALKLATAALVLSIGSCILGLPAGLVAALPVPLPFYLCFSLVVLAALLGWGQHFVFLLFLRSAARQLEEKGLARSLDKLIFAWGLTVAVSAGLTVLLLLSSLRGSLHAARKTGSAVSPSDVVITAGVAGAVLLLAIGLASLVMFSWYFVCLLRVRDDLDETLGRLVVARRERPIWLSITLTLACFFLVDVVYVIIASKSGRPVFVPFIRAVRYK